MTCKFLLGYTDITWHTHGDMVRALEAPTKRKLIAMPRGTFKSSIGVVGYAIWLLIRNPNLRILIDSEKYENSKNFIREIRHKLESPLISNLFGDAVGAVWGEGELVLQWRSVGLKEGSVTASGIEAGKTGQHYDIIIHDDINSAENSRTTEARQKVIDHYRLNTSILEPDGIMVIIGTRYSADDLIGFVLENEID